MDEKKTASLRARMAKKRGKTKVFDFGGTIPELKKRCKRETGLEAPATPVFRSWNRDETAAKPKRKTTARKKPAAAKKPAKAKKKTAAATRRRRKAA